MTRRAVIGTGVITVGCAVVGSGALIRSERISEGMRCLTAPECSTVQALGAALFPAKHVSITPESIGLVRLVDDIVWDTLDPVRRLAFRGLLRSLELGTLAVRGRRFSRLSVSEQREVLKSWAAPDPASRRVAYDSLQAVLAMAYYGHPAVREQIGWAPGCARKGAS